MKFFLTYLALLQRFSTYRESSIDNRGGLLARLAVQQVGLLGHFELGLWC